jgi:hypothetical protein
MPDRRTENLRDMLLDVSSTLEELHLSENAMEKQDFNILATAFASLPKLKVLNCSVNRI